MIKYNFDKVTDRRGTYSTQWDYIADRFGEKDLLPFSVSDTDFQAPEPVVRALEKQISRQIFGYTRWNHSAFKGSIVHWYKQRFSTVVEQDWVLYSPAVCYSISLLVQLKSKAGDQVVVFAPMYDAFFQVIQQNNRELVACSLINEDGKYQIDFDLLDHQLSSAKIMLLNNPHNPTGRVFTATELKQIISLCEKHQVFLISDDIHMDIVYEGSKYVPILSLTEQLTNCCICTSASKSMNISGLTGSYLLVPDAALREEFLRLLKGRDALSSISIPGMHAMMAAYQEGAEYVDQLVHYLLGNMNLIAEFIAARIPQLSLVRAEGTYLAWIDARRLNKTDDEIQKLLIQTGKVGIMSGRTYGQQGYLRMNAGCPRSKLVDGLERMERSFKK